MNSKKEWKGEALEENEYLLKIRKANIRGGANDVGFLTKLTQKGEVPKAFYEWNRGGIDQIIYVHREVPTIGWKFVDYRIGKSQSWATVLHPDGFELEIYLSNFIGLIDHIVIDKGNILGTFTWEYSKLIKSN